MSLSRNGCESVGCVIGDLIASVFSPAKGLVGQTEWPQHFPACGGSSQSPVDVATTRTRFDPSLTPLTPLGYDQHGHRPFTLHNNGHTGRYGCRELSGRHPSSAAAGLFMLLRPHPSPGSAAFTPRRHFGGFQVLFLSPAAVIELPDWMGLSGLPWLFTAVQMHLHWGSGGPSHGGSEHTINGLSADAEVCLNRAH